MAPTSTPEPSTSRCCESTAGILALAEREGIEMPIAEQVGKVLYEGATAAEILENLLGREAKSETTGLA